MRRLNSRLVELTAKVDMIGKAVDDFQEYSYQYNLKIVGIPELNSKESASESSLLCLNLFNEIGAEVSPHDIDYAHRIPTRTASAGPRPIICKFTRRLAKENVMLRRKDACKTDPTKLGLTNQVSLEAVRIFDHLSPKMQQVLFDAKRFKEQHHFQFCWTKGSVVCLRKNTESPVFKIKDAAALQRLAERQS